MPVSRNCLCFHFFLGVDSRFCYLKPLNLTDGQILIKVRLKVHEQHFVGEGYRFASEMAERRMVEDRIAGEGVVEKGMIE